MRDRFEHFAGDGSDGWSWVAFSDVALSILFVFLVFIFAQFVHYQKIAVLEELEVRKDTVKALLERRVPESFRGALTVDSSTGFSQRLTFASDLLFDPCKDDVTTRGDSLMVLVGSLLGTKSTYFYAIEVEGHTDVRRPRGPPSCPFRDNWELSSRRAATVVRTLQEESELPPKILSSVGKGEFHPKSGIEIRNLAEIDQFTDADFAPDRRIEVLLQYSDQDIRDSLDAQ